MWRYFTRKNFIIAALSLILLLSFLFLAGVVWVKSGRFDQWVATQLTTQLAEFGIRTEIGAVKPSLRDLSLELENVKLYPEKEKEPFTTFEKLNATVKFSDLFKLGKPTGVSLQNLKIDGLKFWYKLDENGVSNLSKLKFDKKKDEPDKVEFDYTAANVELHRAEIFYIDQVRKFDGTARNLELKITPDRDKFFRLISNAENCSFTIDDKETNDVGFKLNALANEHGAKVESLQFASPLFFAEMQGEMKDWQKLDYNLKAKADVKVTEITRVFLPKTRLNGTAKFEGTVTGQGIEYQANGKLLSDSLVARDIRVEGINLKFNGNGKGTEFESTEEVLFQKLDAAGFKINRAVASGKIAGNGEDFTWLLNFKAADLAGPDIKASGINFSNAKINFRGDDLSKFKATGKARIEHLITADVNVGNITGDVTATRNEIFVPNFNGSVFGGNANGSARIRLDNKSASEISANLTSLNLDQATAVSAGKRLPLRGTADGKVNVAWRGFDFKSAEGTANLKFKGTTTGIDDGLNPIAGLPINGELNAVASNRRIRINNTKINTGATDLIVSGDIGWDQTGALDVALNSSNAAELQALAVDIIKKVDSELGNKIADEKVQLTNQLSFNGKVTGSLRAPAVSGNFNLSNVNYDDDPLGSIAGNLTYSGNLIKVDNGRLLQDGGGNAEFAVNYPMNVTNGLTIKTTLHNLSVGELKNTFIPLPVSIDGKANGYAEISGLPGAMNGNAEVKISNALYGTKAFDEVSSKINFTGKNVELSNLKLRAGDSALTGDATINTETKGYRAKLRGEGIDLNEWVNVAKEEKEERVPVTGRVNIEIDAEAAKTSFEQNKDNFSGYFFDRLDAVATGSNITYKDEKIGKARLVMKGSNNVSALDLEAEAFEQTYTGKGNVDFNQKNAPVNLAVNFNEVELTKFLDVASSNDLNASGKASGQFRVAGFLFSETDPIRVESEFSKLGLIVGDYNLAAQTPFTLKANANQIDLGTIKLSGTNTNVVVSGAIAVGENGKSNLSINGDVNLKLLQTFVKDVFADGVVKIQGAASGNFKQPRFSGTATLVDGSLRVPGFPLGLTRAKGKLLFTADQAQLASFEGDTGGGKIRATGGVAFVGFKPNRWRFQIKPEGVRYDYPRDTRTTFDGDLELQGTREFQLISGPLSVRRTEYLADVDFFEFMERMTGQFGNATISAASTEESIFPPTQVDIRVIANETLTLRNKLLDATGSTVLRIKGPLDDPTVGGRITVTRGVIDNIFNQRFRINNSGTLEFSGVDKRGGQINLEAEADIKNYRVIANVTGALEQPRIKFRSEPSLPEADVINLITTGNLRDEFATNSSSSSQALAKTSLNTAASLIAQRASRSVESNVTSRLFGLNRFSVDPLLTGRGTDPTARVTIGRRITKDLSITYSASLTSSQEQIILIEYQVSDKLTLVANRSLDGSIGFDVRLRKRF